jgi:hypothetical protein
MVFQRVLVVSERNIHSTRALSHFELAIKQRKFVGCLPLVLAWANDQVREAPSEKADVVGKATEKRGSKLPPILSLLDLTTTSTNLSDDPARLDISPTANHSGNKFEIIPKE